MKSAPTTWTQPASAYGAVPCRLELHLPVTADISLSFLEAVSLIFT